MRTMNKKKRKKRSSFSRSGTLIIAVAVIILGYLIASKAYNFGYRLFAEEPMSLAPGIEKVVVIEEGMRLKEVAKMLEKGGVIRDAGIFKVQNKLSHYSSNFEAGTYTLNTSMTNEEIMAILSGESY